MARTVRTKVYKFEELSKEAQQKAINNHRNKGYDQQFYYDEIIESVKAVVELFDLKTGNKYTDIRHGHIEDTILELSGVRLYKWLINNYYNQLFRPVYIKSLDRPVRWKQFICKVNKDHKGDEYTMLYSKIKRNTSCVLTGMCWDDSLLEPIYKFLSHPEKSTTFEDLISEIESAIQKTFETTEDWLNSDEFIKDEILANEYEFTADGRQF